MPELNSIDDIDKMLDAEYSNLKEESVTEEVSEEPEVVEETQEPDTEVAAEETPAEIKEEEPAEPETQEVKPVESKPTKDEQQSYSFKALREERDNYRKQSEQYESDSTFLKELAGYYGYTDSDAFKKALRDAQLEKEATNKGVDPVMYKELSEQRERIRQLEKEQETRELNIKAEEFNNAVEDISKELGLGEDGKDIIFQRLIDNGYTQLNQVLELPNVKPLLKGILSDYVKTSVEQKQIKAIEKVNSVSDSPANDSGTDTGVSLDDIIAKEMKKYKEDNFL